MLSYIAFSSIVKSPKQRMNNQIAAALRARLILVRLAHIEPR
jgi:hypothetical protein